jgi:hypothetical protein
MAQVTKGRTFSNGETITPGKLHEFIDFAQVSNIATADINDAAITGPKLANNAVTTVKITDANVTTAKIADANVTTAKIADANVTTAKIADAAITGPKLANNAVTTVKITDANVTTAKIADANVTTAKIADANVTTAKIADANVTTAKIADANVTTAKIADAAVTGPKIAAGASISYPVLTGVREAIVNTGTVSGTQTLNLHSGNIFQIKPNGAITIAFSNIPTSGTFVGVLIRHEGDGTARTYTWPANTKWAYGEQPAFTSTNGKFDIVSLFTYNGGTNWFGQIIGQNY